MKSYGLAQQTDIGGELHTLTPETAVDNLVRSELVGDVLRLPLTGHVRFDPESVKDTEGQDGQVNISKAGPESTANSQSEPTTIPAAPPIEAFQVTLERAAEFSRDFYDQHAPMLTRVLNLAPNDCADILQLTLMKALRNLHRHDASSNRNDPAWLITIAKNARIDAWRKQQREAAYDFQEDSGMADKAIDPDMDDIIHRNATMRAIGRLLGDQGNEFHRSLLEIINYVFIQNMPIDDYAAQASIPSATVRTRIHRLRKLLNQWREQGAL